MCVILLTFCSWPVLLSSQSVGESNEGVTNEVFEQNQPISFEDILTGPAKEGQCLPSSVAGSP